MATNLSVIFNAIDNMSSRLGSIASSGRAVESSFQGIENSANESLGNIEAGSDAISQSFERTSESAASLASSVGAYGGEAANAAGSANSLASSSSSAETSLIEAANAAEDAAEELGDMGEQAEQAGDSSEEFGERSARAMDNLNSLLVSGGIVAAVHKIAEEFAECAAQAEVVETSIAQLQTIAGGGAIGTLSEELMELSNDTGQAAEGLADTAYNAISAGTAAEESVEAASQANQLAVAGFTDTSSALSVLETAMNSYGEAAGGMEHVSDSLITVQNLGVTTVAQLAAQMGKAISTASAYNVSLENLESGYISVTKAGISTAEGTTYLSSMLNELGNSGSEISKLLKEETGNTFGELMNEGKSLADVLGIVYDACDNNAEAMMNMWGSAEAGKAANAIIGQGLDKFNENLTTLREGAGTTAEAYAIMAGTTAYAHNKMDNAAKNMSVQIGEILNPALTGLYEKMEKLYTGIGNVVAQHPMVVKVITALVVGAGAVGAGLAAVTLATKARAAAAAIHAAVTATETAAIAAQIAVVTGIVVAVGVFAALVMSTTDNMEELTTASQAQKDELEETKAEYEEVCQKFGETDDKALILKSRVDELTESFEASKMTVSQFYDNLASLCDSHDEIVDTYTNTNISIREQELATDDLITKLNGLKDGSEESAVAQQQMEAIVQRLGEMYPSLGISIEDVNNNLGDMVNKINAVAKAQNAQTKYDTAKTTYADLIAEQSELEAAKEEAWKLYVDAGQRFEDASVLNQGYAAVTGTGVAKAMDDAEAAYKRASDALEENKRLQEECTQTMDEYSQMVDGTSDQLVSAEDATAIAMSKTEEKVNKLAEAYKEAYDSAKDSIEGQYSLWDKVDKKVLEAKKSVDKIGTALDSQIQYWENYSKNLDNLRGRDVKGLDDVLKNMDDGSEESAAALAGMAKASDKELEKIVKKYDKLQNAQGKTAEKVADLETDFNSSLDKMETKMKKTIRNMTMESDAAAAAKKTIQSYIDNIRSGISGAKSAAEAVSNAVAKALKTPDKKAVKSPNVSERKLPELPDLYSTFAPKTIEANASGTTDSDTVYVAGEEGPELILSGGGDTVFPTSETDKIISAVSGENDNRQITEPSLMSRPVTTKSESYDESAGSDRTLTIRLEGGGTISVGAGSSKEEIWNGTKGKIKSAFMQILKEEVFEEGAGAYEF